MTSGMFPNSIFLGSTVETVHASVFGGFGSIALIQYLVVDLGSWGRFSDPFMDSRVPRIRQCFRTQRVAWSDSGYLFMR